MADGIKTMGPNDELVKFTDDLTQGRLETKMATHQEMKQTLTQTLNYKHIFGEQNAFKSEKTGAAVHILFWGAEIK